MTARVLVISGSMGSGKTTVLGEASDLLSARRIVHAVVDLDAIATAGLADDVSTDVTFGISRRSTQTCAPLECTEFCWPRLLTAATRWADSETACRTPNS